MVPSKAVTTVTAHPGVLPRPQALPPLSIPPETVDTAPAGRNPVGPNTHGFVPLQTIAFSTVKPTDRVDAQRRNHPSRWPWPIPTPVNVIEEFRAPPNPWSSGRRGISLAAETGTTVLAPAEGRVSFVGVVVDRPVITIEHPGGLRTSYEPVDSTLANGDLVSPGSPIGTIASGGVCPQMCLHVGVRSGDEYVNPRRYFGSRARLVLLTP
ncbi:murein hydrolase activator EnvC family protein [Mycetocola saprophilus]|uniref:murein hydrolase activator EnvC family protein n=1 Tax=Mycetocola saprophilus TaxID=76636 RepID=UPI003BF24CF5